MAFRSGRPSGPRTRYSPLWKSASLLVIPEGKQTGSEDNIADWQDKPPLPGISQRATPKIRHISSARRLMKADLSAADDARHHSNRLRDIACTPLVIRRSFQKLRNAKYSF